MTELDSTIQFLRPIQPHLDHLDSSLPPSSCSFPVHTPTNRLIIFRPIFLLHFDTPLLAPLCLTARTGAQALPQRLGRPITYSPPLKSFANSTRTACFRNSRRRVIVSIVGESLGQLGNVHWDYLSQRRSQELAHTHPGRVLRTRSLLGTGLINPNLGKLKRSIYNMSGLELPATQSGGSNASEFVSSSSGAVLCSSYRMHPKLTSTPLGTQTPSVIALPTLPPTERVTN